MRLAFLGMILAFGLSLLQLAYFNFPGVFLLQLGFGECFFFTPAHSLWTLVALGTPVLASVTLWQSSRAFQSFARHPLFAFHHLLVFLAGLLLANGFFGLRLLNRLESAPLQATLLVGYFLTLDFCLRILSGARIANAATAAHRPLWLVLMGLLTLTGVYLTQDLKPTLRMRDLGVLRLRFIGRAVWESPCPVCFSRQTLRTLPEITK